MVPETASLYSVVEQRNENAKHKPSEAMQKLVLHKTHLNDRKYFSISNVRFSSKMFASKFTARANVCNFAMKVQEHM